MQGIESYITTVFEDRQYKIRTNHFIDLLNSKFPEKLSGLEFITTRDVLESLTEISSADIRSYLAEKLFLDTSDGPIKYKSDTQLLPVSTKPIKIEEKPTEIQYDENSRYKNVSKFNTARLVREFGRRGFPYNCASLKEGRAVMRKILNQEYKQANLSPLDEGSDDGETSSLLDPSLNGDDCRPVSDSKPPKNSESTVKDIKEPTVPLVNSLPSLKPLNQAPNERAMHQYHKSTDPYDRQNYDPNASMRSTYQPSVQQNLLNQTGFPMMPNVPNFPINNVGNCDNYPQWPHGVPTGSKRPLYEPIKFSGQPSEDVFDFVRSYNKAARVNKWSDREKIDLLENYLTGTALKYLKGLDETYGINLTFQQAVESLLNTFSPVHRQTRLEMELLSMKQGINQTVEDFIISVESLARRFDINMPENKIVNICLKGLRKDIAKDLLLRPMNTMFELREGIRVLENREFLLNQNIGGTSFGQTMVESPVTTHKDTEVIAMVKSMQDQIKTLCANVSQPVKADPTALPISAVSNQFMSNTREKSGENHGGRNDRRGRSPSPFRNRDGNYRSSSLTRNNLNYQSPQRNNGQWNRSYSPARYNTAYNSNYSDSSRSKHYDSRSPRRNNENAYDARGSRNRSNSRDRNFDKDSRNQNFDKNSGDRNFDRGSRDRYVGENSRSPTRDHMSMNRNRSTERQWSQGQNTFPQNSKSSPKEGTICCNCGGLKLCAAQYAPCSSNSHPN